MKILIFSWRGPGHPNYGGAEIVTHNHAKSWVKEGNSVTLVTSDFSGAKKTEYKDGVKIIRHGNQVLGVHLKSFFWYIFGKESYDLVIDQFHGIPFFTPLFVRTKKIAFIHEVTKDVWKLNSLPRPFDLILGYFGLFFEPFIFKLYKNVSFFTVSDSTRKELIDWGIKKEKIKVIQNGINKINLKQKFSKNKTPTISYFGALSKDKGFETAINSFYIIQKKLPNCQFWVIGKSEDGYISKLKESILKSGLKNHIKFWGYVKDDFKYKLLSKSHLVINPSVREGWGLTVIEAASVGTPTIAFDVPGLRDSIINNKTGILVREKNAKALAMSALKILKNKKKYLFLCSKAKKWGNSFDWKKSTTQSLSFINSIK